MIKLNTSLSIIFLTLFLACKNQESPESPNTDIPPAISSKSFTYESDTTMQGYLAYPSDSSKKYPGVLVVHEWWGHNDYARKRADMLAELGYVALALDMYGDGKVASHPQDAMAFAGSVMQNIEVGKRRFESALEVLKSQSMVNAEKIAAIGYCFGGSVILSMANAGYNLDAVAAFHSGVQLPIMPGQDSIIASILVCNGADDPFITTEQVENYVGALDKAGADFQYIAYEGAVHSFTSPHADSLGKKFEMPLAYNATADEQSWEEMKLLFERKLK